MKDKIYVMNKSVRTKGEDSLPTQGQMYFPMLQEFQDEDFLLNKTPNNLEYSSWEDDE